MAAVKINTGMPRPEDPAASLPEDRWEDLLIVRRYWVRSQLPFDCRLLRQVAEDAQLMAPKRGHASAEEFLRKELELDPDLVSRVVGWLAQEQPSNPVPLADAIEAAKAQPLAEPDQGGPGRGHKSADNVSPLQHGNSQAYLLRRIARDQPELLDQIGEGKPYRSARAAAIAAGIIKPVPTIRLVDDVAKVASALRRHLTEQQITALVEELGHA